METKYLSSYLTLERLRRSGVNAWSEEMEVCLSRLHKIPFSEARHIKMSWIRNYSEIEQYLESKHMINPRDDNWNPDAGKKSDTIENMDLYSIKQKMTVKLKSSEINDEIIARLKKSSESQDEKDSQMGK